MTKFFRSLLFKGVVVHLLLFVFYFLVNFQNNFSDLWNFLFYYFSSLAILIFILIQPSQSIRKISEQVDGFITGDFSMLERPKGHNEFTVLYAKILQLGKNVSNSQNRLESQRNQLDSILTYMVDGVIATDRHGKIVLANKSALHYLNMREEDDIYNQNIVQVLDIEDKYSFYDLLEKEPEIVLDTTSATNEAISLRTNFILFRSETGFISGIIAILHDSTEQEKSEREQQLFVSNVSHELRTPLTSVKAYLEALEDGAIDDREIATSFIGVSLNETDRMIRMISDLLTLSRVDQDRLVLNKEIINISAFLNFQLDRWDKIIENDTAKSLKTPFRIVRSLPENPLWLEIDTDKMTRVIDNIIGNSIKYSPDGGDISVTLKVQDNHVILTISDQGLGIPKEDLPKIFKRFYRVDKARNSNTGGAGLGLSFVYDIINLHGGTVSASSDGEGLGTTFSVSLPYNSNSEDEENDDDWDLEDFDEQVEKK
ncbi:ATP-binding protein [Lactococcus nasutitermitis]|uniref:histidine kinase n=1 Tax=Lactococcus nasutitermitis TaxID=1652957 RepID=A0ABV9JB50_9LACT|nr:ATP-binding protein [Lactococcus nasutitermitis]